MTTLARCAFAAVCALSFTAATARAQAKRESCLPVDQRGYGFHADLAERATDRTPAGEEARAHYHLPVATQAQVRQEIDNAKCSRAIDAIRASRPDGQAPSSVYLFQVKNVYVIAAADGRPFTGMVWTFDSRMRTLLGGVMQ